MNTCTSLWNAMQQQIQLSRNITWNALRMHIFRSSLNIESVVKCCDCVLHDVLCLFSLTALRLCVFFFSHLPFGFVCIRLCWYAMYDDDAAAAAISCRCCKLCLHEYECVSCVVSFFTLSLSHLFPWSFCSFCMLAESVLHLHLHLRCCMDIFVDASHFVSYSFFMCFYRPIVDFVLVCLIWFSNCFGFTWCLQLWWFCCLFFGFKCNHLFCSVNIC